MEELPLVIAAFTALVNGATKIVEDYSAGKVTADQAVAALGAAQTERKTARAGEDAEIDQKFPA